MISQIFDFETYACRFLNIITKTGRLVPLTLNNHQKRLLSVIESQRAQKKPVRIICLKARQAGSSTLASAYIYHRTATRFFQRSMLIAHDNDSSGNLFAMIKRYHDLSPKVIQPLSKYSNRKELVFAQPNHSLIDQEPGLMSSIEIDTAGSLTAGRSTTLQNLHISELAHWPNAKETMSGLLQALSGDVESTCIIESTALGIAGIGQDFYERWNASESGSSGFIPFFIPWTDIEEYKVDYKIVNLNQKERELLNQGLTLYQLGWRRMKIDMDFSGDEQLFAQEYPLNPREAFISSGRSVFDIAKITQLIDKCRDVKYEYKNTNVKIFSQPEPNKVYVCAADISEGIEGGDASVATILDLNNNQCAILYCHLDVDKFAAELVELAKYFNNALLNWETNAMGVAITSNIKRIGYPHLYLREFFEKQTIDLNDKLGWRTDVRTKRLMLQDLIAAVRDNAILINDIDTLREMSTLFYDENGNCELNGKDRTVALCLALQTLKQAPSAIKYKAISNVDEDKPPKFETLGERLKRISKRGDDNYFH